MKRHLWTTGDPMSRRGHVKSWRTYHLSSFRSYLKKIPKEAF